MGQEIPIPLCASCKFGLCVEQMMPIEDDTMDNTNDENWGLDDEGPDNIDSTPVTMMLTWSSLCWWRPDGQTQNPIELMHVRSCSRHEPRNKSNENSVPEKK